MAEPTPPLVNAFYSLDTFVTASMPKYLEATLSCHRHLGRISYRRSGITYKHCERIPCPVHAPMTNFDVKRVRMLNAGLKLSITLKDTDQFNTEDISTFIHGVWSTFVNAVGQQTNSKPYFLWLNFRFLEDEEQTAGGWYNTSTRMWCTDVDTPFDYEDVVMIAIIASTNQKLWVHKYDAWNRHDLACGMPTILRMAHGRRCK
jgi:hypothetical protein